MLHRSPNALLSGSIFVLFDLIECVLFPCMQKFTAMKFLINKPVTQPQHKTRYYECMCMYQELFCEQKDKQINGKQTPTQKQLKGDRTKTTVKSKQIYMKRTTDIRLRGKTIVNKKKTDFKRLLAQLPPRHARIKLIFGGITSTPSFHCFFPAHKYAHERAQPYANNTHQNTKRRGRRGPCHHSRSGRSSGKKPQKGPNACALA